MWVLFLNDMRSSNIENVEPVARAYSKEALEAYLAREAVDGGYSEETDYSGALSRRWGKTYRKDGPLEWYNPPWNDGPEHFRYVGTEQDWVERTKMQYQTQVMYLPEVTA